MKLENLKEELEYQLKTIEKQKQEFVEKFQKNAFYTLDWSNDMFREVAKEKVHLIILGYYNAPENQYKIMEVLLSVAEKSMRQKAKYPTFSTSPTSNLASTYEGAAWAEMYEFLKKVK